VSAWGGYRGCHGNAEGYAAPGTVLVHTPESTYGSLRVDAGPKLAGAAGSVATFLPTLGSGAAVATEVDVADLWLTGDSDLWPRWDGAWVSLADAGGADLGLFQVVARDAAGRLRLADAASAVAAATYQGRYLFDSIEVLRGADLTAEEPIESGAVTFDGVTEITGEVVAIDVLVKSGATVRPAAGGDLRFQVSGTMTIEAGAKLDVSGKGYRGTTTDRYDPAGAPSWVTASKCGAGGSHGGRGSIYGYWECSFGPAGDVYGSVYEPWLSGGGGAMVNNDDGGDGGGRIYIEAGALILDGEVLARGEGLDAVDVEAGGGAGGSVQIHTGELSGSGLVDASGGNNIQVCVNFNDWSSAGAGGGGRVGLYADTLNGFDPATQVRAWGGYHGCPGALQYAAPGTILTVTSASTYGDLLIDAGSKPGGEAAVHSTFLPTLGSGDVALAEVDGADLWLTSDSDLWPRWLGAWVSLADAAGESLGLFQVTDRDVDGRLRLAGAAAATTAVTYRGHYVFDSVEVLAGADLTATEPIEAGSVTFDGVAEITGEVVAVDVLVKSGATVRPASGSNLSFKVSGTMTVEAGAKIDVTGYGYEGAFRDFSISGWPNVPAEAPPWVTPSVCASGGSHGGAGNFKNVGGFSPNCTWGPAGEVYGSVYEPSLGGGGGVHNLGSSVLGGDGGGTITIEAGALVLDGELRARGQSVMETDSGSGTDSPAGAGAGGSVLLQVGQLSGAGLIDVTGGDQDQEPCANTWDQKGGGAGGGGRVGIYADDLSGFDTASQVKAWGGYRGCYGNAEGYAAAGTILVFTPESTHGGLRIDAGPQAQGSATTVKTWLPNPGIDTMVEFEVAGNDAWLTGTKVFHPRWVGATTHLMDAAGETLGRFWVIRIDADGRALLQDAATAIAQTVSYEGEYWFDTFELGGGAGWNSSAPVFVMDEQVSLAETELSVAEDDAAGAIFTVTLPEASTLDISIDYTTVDGTAIAGDDYVATSGTVVIPAGQLSAPVTVDLIADLVHEPAETFELELTAATPGVVVASAARATLTIQNDDVFSQVTVGDRFVVEPETGSRVSAVRVTLDPPAAEQITVDYQTAGGTATPSVDFTPVTGTLTFEAGESSKTIGVDILANSEQESAEAFWLDLTAVTRAELADARAEITIYDGQTPVPDAPHAAGFLVDYEEDAYHIVQENPSWEQYNGGALWNHKTIAKVGAGDRLRLRTRPELLRTDHKLVLGVLNDRWNGFSISVGDWTSPVRYNSQHRSPEFHDEIEITIPRDVITDETFEVTFTPGGNNTYTSAYLTSFKLYAATDDQDFQRGVNYYWAGTGWAWHSGEWNRKRMASLNHGTSGTIPMTTSSPDDGHVFYLTTVDDRASAFRIQVGSWTSGVVAAPQDGGSPFVELAIDIPAGTIPGESFDVTVVNETLDTAFVGKLHAIEVRLVRKGNGSALVDYEDDAYQISQDTDCVLYSSNLWNGRTMCKGKRSEVSTGATLNLQTRPEHLLSDHQLILGTLNNRWEGWQITVNGWTSPVRYNSQHMSPAVHEDLVLTIPGYVVTSTELDVQLTPGSNNTFTNHYITHYRLIANTGDQDLQRGVTFHWADGWDWRGDEWNRKRLAKANAEEGSEKISMTTSDPADAHLFYFTTLDDRDSSVQIQVGSWTSEWVTAPQDGGSPFVELAIEIPANTIPATDFEVTVIDGTTDNDGKLHLTEVRLVRLPEPPAAPTAELSVGPTASATEGDPAGMIFDVTLSEPTLVDVAIDYVLRDDTALAGVDYQPTSGLMTLPAGQTSAQIVVPLIANTTIEPHRTFELELTAASSAVLGATLAVATLLDDDRPNLSIGDAVVTEPTTGSASVEVALTLDAAPVFEVTVSYQTVDGTAVAGEDYTTQTGSLTFAPGETSQTISLTVLADGIAEPAEAFNVTLGVPSEAVLLDGDGEVSVLDSGDAPPVAAFTVDCSGLRCTFDASGSTDDVGIATYSWDFGDGTQLSTAEAIVEHRLPAVLGGQFTIQLTVIDDGDQQAGATQDITVISLEQLLPLLTH
ncbi:MAG: Calx-beta domain-containing protein, partial [Acidobacteriota bacterium]